MWDVSVELQDTQNKQKLQNEKFLATVGFKPTTLCYKADALSSRASQGDIG